ncbi:Arabinose operon regulatory protein [Defluviimonas aquaemixtae]|uniref:Arabinose operon regulatory protein n=1 Tax=Albidovulum aquaemixtae TaxID=1542388 RepID=A0A2R8B5V1_9RHOB|nr:AraC family transcriptional regulator [Defluviimonas aquaemixtae]SPH17985.1 Arabinose operon regulatory protein [Defluviimonas aquaemixtae]
MKLFTGPPLSQFSDRPEEARAETADAGLARQVSTRPARVIQIARLVSGGRWRVEAMRSISEPLLIWFTRGQGRITVGGVTRGYGAHNAVFVPAGVMHGFEVSPQTHGAVVFFGHGAPVALPKEPQHLRIREVAPQVEVSGLIDNIQRELDSGRAGSDRAAHLHLGLLGVWLERHIDTAQDSRRKPDAARKLATRYTEVLEREFRSGKGVAQYAQTLGVTPTHLTRVCKQTCGRSASDILHDRVIFEARLLLCETTMPIAQISETLGFNSPAYFTRAFQHRTGKTPSAFRRQG